jgi:uncharacterized protein (TIGR02270 family)
MQRDVMQNDVRTEVPFTKRVATVSAIVEQHVEEAGSLYAIRSRLCEAESTNLEQLHRFDRRIDAHLDGLRVAGDECWWHIDRSLAKLDQASAFVATICALESKSRERLHRVYALASSSPEAVHGVLAGLAWVSPIKLIGVVNKLIHESNAILRYLGIATCATHRVSAEKALTGCLIDSDLQVQGRALRAVGELGRLEHMQFCMARIYADDSFICYNAAQAAVLLGDRNRALGVLVAFAADRGYRGRAFDLGLQAMSRDRATTYLKELSSRKGKVSALVWGCGVVGDTAYVPWLIKRMKDATSARLAGTAFSLITGADLTSQNLERTPPGRFQELITDDPDDDCVDVDDDFGRPWPDPQRVSQWWESNRSRFNPGQRYFVGKPITRENCINVLVAGCQHQRVLAAHYLCLLDPGTPLFEWRAPAYRQKKLLATMV